jgi:hypothetical protein
MMTTFHPQHKRIQSLLAEPLTKARFSIFWRYSVSILAVANVSSAIGNGGTILCASAIVARTAVGIVLTCQQNKFETKRIVETAHLKKYIESRSDLFD